MDNIICEECKADSGYNVRPVTTHAWAKTDAYGIYTGIYCDDCYNSDKYPYRKDYYHDPAYCGERMNEDY